MNAVNEWIRHGFDVVMMTTFVLSTAYLLHTFISLFLRPLVQPVIKDPSLAGVQASWRITNVHQNHTTLMGAGIINVIHFVILPFIKRFAHTGVFCGSAELVRKDLLIKNGGWAYGVMRAFMNHGQKLLLSRLTRTRTKLAAVGLPMQWFMVRKNGNVLATA
jgi:hypothetical protein